MMVASCPAGLYTKIFITPACCKDIGHILKSSSSSHYLPTFTMAPQPFHSPNFAYTADTGAVGKEDEPKPTVEEVDLEYYREPDPIDLDGKTNPGSPAASDDDDIDLPELLTRSSGPFLAGMGFMAKLREKQDNISSRPEISPLHVVQT